MFNVVFDVTLADAVQYLWKTLKKPSKVCVLSYSEDNICLNIDLNNSIYSAMAVFLLFLEESTSTTTESKIYEDL